MLCLISNLDELQPLHHATTPIKLLKKKMVNKLVPYKWPRWGCLVVTLPPYIRSLARRENGVAGVEDLPLQTLGKKWPLLGPEDLKICTYLCVHMTYEYMIYWHDISKTRWTKKRFAAWPKTHQRLKTVWCSGCLWIFVSPKTDFLSFRTLLKNWPISTPGYHPDPSSTNWTNLRWS